MEIKPHKIKLSISVMIHPKRKEFEPYLREKLGDVPFVWDEINSCWDTSRRAWLAYDPTADFHVVIQDDAIVCEDFKNRAEQFISKWYQPNWHFNFFFGNRTGTLRALIGEGVATGKILKNGNTWGVAICVPTKLIPDMIKFCDRLDIRQDDIRIGRYLRSIKFFTCYPMPSLIDHRDSESLVGDKGTGRQAYWFVEDKKAGKVWCNNHENRSKLLKEAQQKLKEE